MTARTRLDGKVRWTLGLILLILLPLPILAVRSYIARVTAENVTITPESVDERLVIIGKRKMLVPPGGLEAAMTDWFDADNQQTFEFELSERSFAPGSAELSRTSVTRVSQLAGLTKTHPSLMVHILLPEYAESASNRQLDHQRAQRLHDEIVARGIDQSRVTIGNESDDLPTAKSLNLAVLLSKQ